MEATNYIFMVLTAMLLVGLMGVFVGGFSTAYPTQAYNSSNLQIYQNFSNQVASMQETVGGSTNATYSISAQDTSIFAGFGYLWSAFNGAVKLFSIIPDWINNTIYVLTSMLGLPTFTGGGLTDFIRIIIGIIISTTVLLGMLYYWLKVK